MLKPRKQKLNDAIVMNQGLKFRKDKIKATGIYRVYQKKLNKSKIALRLYKAPQYTKFFIEIGCLATYNVE